MGAVSAVSVTFSDHMEELAASDPRLNPDALVSAIESELRAFQLYNAGGFERASNACHHGRGFQQ